MKNGRCSIDATDPSTKPAESSRQYAGGNVLKEQIRVSGSTTNSGCVAATCPDLAGPAPVFDVANTIVAHEAYELKFFSPRGEEHPRRDWNSRSDPLIVLMSNLRDFAGTEIAGLGAGEIAWHSDQSREEKSRVP